MKTKDGIDYVDGMTLYQVGWDDEDDGPFFGEHKDTIQLGPCIYASSSYGRINIGGAGRHYALKCNAVNVILERLREMEAGIQKQIKDWEAL